MDSLYLDDDHKKKNRKPFIPTKSDKYYESLTSKRYAQQKKQYQSCAPTSMNPFANIHFYSDSEIHSRPHVVRKATRHLKPRRRDTRGEFILNANRQNHASAMRRVHRKQWLANAIKSGRVKDITQAASHLNVTVATVSKYLREIKKAKHKHNS